MEIIKKTISIICAFLCIGIPAFTSIFFAGKGFVAIFELMFGEHFAFHIGYVLLLALIMAGISMVIAYSISWMYFKLMKKIKSETIKDWFINGVK